MSLLIETLNLWGERAVGFAWPMLWQSSILIALLFAFDFAFRRRIRAAVRYALWPVVLVKLLLPPSLALPTSFAWWVRPPAPPPKAQEHTTAFVVTYSDIVPAMLPTPAAPIFVPPPKPSLSRAGWAIASWAVVGAGLLAWLLVRWQQVALDVRRATDAPNSLKEVLDEARRSVRSSRRVRLRLTKRAMSPAVCGLFRPVILLPHSLVDKLTPAQLRAVLLHELLHLRRGDVWVNCAQTLLQIFYWWHPLFWLANARIRRVREEAVDDAVMLALRDDAEAYAPTLLEVARLAFNRPLASLGLVGIMESRSVLRQRIERLVDFRPPRKSGLTVASAFCILAFAALAVPMEQAPPTSGKPNATSDKSNSLGTSASSISSNAASSKITAAALVQDGRLLLEAGKLEEAESKLREAIVVDPENRAAFYYLSLVKEQRYARAERQRNRDLGEGRQIILSKLNQIRLDSVSFDKLPLGEIVVWLNDEAKKRDAEKRGVNFILNPDIESPGLLIDPATGLPVVAAGPLAEMKSLRFTINPPLTDVRVKDVLDALIKAAPEPIHYSVEADGVVIYSRKSPEPLHSRTFQLSPNPFYQGLQSAIGIRFSDIESRGNQGILTLLPGATTPREQDGREPGDTLSARPRNSGGLRLTTTTNHMQTVSIAVQKFFTSLGVDLNPALGKSVFWNDRDGKLLVRATKEDLDAIEVGIQSLTAAPDRNVEAERQAVLSSTNAIQVSTKDQNALSGTASSTNGSFGNALPKSLYENTPGPRSTFTLYYQIELREDGSYWAGGKRMNMAELRDWLIRTTQSNQEGTGRVTRIKGEARYSTNNNIWQPLAVGTVLPAGASVQTTKDSYLPAAHSSIGFEVNTNAPPEAIRALIELRKELGMPADSASTLPSSPNHDQLFTRAFRVDPNAFYKGLKSVSAVPVRGTNINAVVRDFFAALGVQLNPPKAIFFNDRDGKLLVRATSQDLETIEAAIQVLNHAPPQINIKMHLVEMEQKGGLGFDWYLGNFLMGSTSSQFHGILTDPQFRVVLHALKQREGVDFLDGPAATTVSGLQAQVQAVDLKTVVTGINPQALVLPGINLASGLTNSLYQTEAIPCGPVLDVIATVAADGYTINLTVIATLTEFLGYDENTNYVTVYVNGKKEDVALPLPKFRTRQMTANTDIRDGHTLLLSNPIDHLISRKPNGEVETTKFPDTNKKALLIYVTPTLVDPSGNRIHSGDEPALKKK